MNKPTPRDLAFIGDADGLRKYAREILKKNPELAHHSDALDLISYLVESDFEGALAKIETTRHKYQGIENFAEVQSTANLVTVHIAFAHGKFDELEEIANQEILDFRNGKSALSEFDILQLMRLKAQKHLIMNENDQIKAIAEEVENYRSIEPREHSYYLINSVLAMHKSLRGENRAALELANRNINIALQNGYVGIMGPLDALYIKAQCLFAMAEENEGLEAFAALAASARKFQTWPWYFLADGQISRQLASNNKLPEALAVVREQRELLSSFRFTHGLSFLADANELFIRFFIKDIERIETLISRMPELNIVKQIRANKVEWEGGDILEWIKTLPTETPRQVIYQLFAFAEYYADKESIAVDYMRQALIHVEEHEATEFLLRQYKIYEIILKAIPKHPTVYQEGIVRKITERVKQKVEQTAGSLKIPLTDREIDVVRHLATGQSISTIGIKLHVSMNTMKSHLRNIYRKLDVGGRDEAVKKAQELFLI